MEVIVTTHPDIATYLSGGQRVHLIGVGGVSMCPLAEVLSSRGLSVSGCDHIQSDAVCELQEHGITVSIGHDASHAHGVDCIIRSAAIDDDNPEVVEARRLGVPLFQRSQALGYLMGGYARALCVAGTHGKTTTTSMATHIALCTDVDPTVMIGGTLPLIGTGYRVGAGDLFIMEACEYCNSFLDFLPTTALILNIEADHLDYFRDLDDIVSSFSKFALLTPERTGSVLLCHDDPGAMRLAALPRDILTFGIAEGADVYPEGLSMERGMGRFAVHVKGQFYADVELKVPGMHNVTNALGAAAAAWQLGFPGDAVSRGLGTFRGATRRLEFLGEHKQATVADDHAHHPTEIEVTFKAARAMGYKRIICAYQPYTYTRTLALFDDFVDVLGMADVVFLSEICAARERDIYGISARALAEKLPNATFFDNMEDIASALSEAARPGDLLLTMGTGDIWKVAQMLLR